MQDIPTVICERVILVGTPIVGSVPEKLGSKTVSAVRQLVNAEHGIDAVVSRNDGTGVATTRML